MAAQAWTRGGGAFGVEPSPPRGTPRAPAAGVFRPIEMEPE